MRTWLLLVLLTSVALSGCAQTEAPTEPTAEAGPEASTEGPASPKNETTETPEADENRAPVATLTADVTNGTAPLNVTFTVDGIDGDGDSLDWTLSANGTAIANGTELPSEVTHQFGAGNHTVVLTVTDGDANATASVDVFATAVAADEVPESHVFEGSVTAPDPFALGGGCIIGIVEAFTFDAGVTGSTHSLPPGLDGWRFQLEPAAAQAQFFSQAGSVGGSGNSGSVGSGMDTVVVCSQEPLTDYTLTISPP